MSVSGFTKRFKAYKLPCIVLKNEMRTWIVGDELQRTPNLLVDPWDLEGYEPVSNPTEIIGPAGILKRNQARVGYICDEQGVTVTLERSGPKITPENSAENKEIVFGFFERISYTRNAEKVPFILISNNGLSVTWGGEIRKKGMVLTDGPGKPVYRIKPETPMIEIVNRATGKTAMGYLVDEIGVTVDLKRDFRVTYPEDDEDPGKLAAIKELNKKIISGEVVGITIRFNGSIGEVGTYDILPKIFDIGQSKRNFYIGVIVGGIIFFIIGLVL
jgi:hypothetical protein